MIIDKLNYSEFVNLCRGQRTIELKEREKERIRQSRKAFEDILKSDPHKSYYAINTGVGALLNRRIPKGRMEEFQENLIMSHTCGIGPPLEREIVKGIMLHMILNLKKGYSVIRLPTLELLVEMFNRNIIPVVPAKGSLGASGDPDELLHKVACLWQCNVLRRLLVGWSINGGHSDMPGFHGA